MKRILSALLCLFIGTACKAQEYVPVGSGIITVPNFTPVNLPGTATPTPTATPTVTPTATAGTWQVLFTEDTTTLYKNPGIGFQSNQSTETQTNAAGSNPQGYPLAVANYRACWKDIEPTQGSRDFTTFTDFLAKARADLQTVNLRLYETDPGDLCGAPAWARTTAGLSGWIATEDDGGSTNLNFSCWNDLDNQAAYASTVQAMATAIAFSPAVGLIDQAYWGSYNEVNYASSHYVGSATGIAPVPAVGANLPTPLPTPNKLLAGIMATAAPSSLVLSFPDDNTSFVNGVSAGYGARGDGWGYKNAIPTQTPVANGVGSISGNFQMGTAYRLRFAGDYSTIVGPGTPTPTPAATYATLWQTKPIALEPFGSFSTWNTNRYPYAASFKWLTDNHASQVNMKGSFNPASGAWDTTLRTTHRGLGYRHYLSSVSGPAAVASSVAFNMDSSWINHGSAPNYLGYKVLYKFVDNAGGTIYKVATSEVANWLPNVTTNISSSITLPSWVVSGTYSVYVGIGNATTLIPEEFLAVTSPASTDGWYLVSTIAVDGEGKGRPDTDYACGFSGGSSQYLELTDRAAMDWLATDGQLCLRVKLGSKASSQGLFTKGDIATAANFEYGLYYWQPTDRFRFGISNGTTVYTIDANSLGSPSTGTWYTVCGAFNNSTKELTIKGNNGTTNTAAGAGNIQNKSQAVRVGADTTGRYATADIDKLWMVKRLWSGTELTNYYNSGDGRRLQDMPMSQKKGTYVALECDESSGTRTDAFQGFPFTQNGGVTQVSSGVSQQLD